MTTKETVHNFFKKEGVNFKKSDSYEKLGLRVIENNNFQIKLSELNDFFRSNWKPKPIKLHINNLKSGKLIGHNWHGALPSVLHLSLQNKVREHTMGKFDLDTLIQCGTDIMKREYFMVCVHDLIETMIIETFPETIPAVNTKSISDFIFNNIPYDLKVTNYFNGYTKNYVNKNKEKVVKELISNADTLRLRKQASKTINNLGLNRFFVLVENQNRWLEEPEKVLDELKNEIKKLKNPIRIKIDDITILTHLVAI